MEPAGTSQMSTGVITVVSFTGDSPVQAAGDVAASMSAIQPVEALSLKRGSAASMTATWPVETPGTVTVATQPVEAVSAWTATQRVEAASARSEVHSQPSSTGSVDVNAVDRSLTRKRTVAEADTGVSDTEDEVK